MEMQHKTLSLEIKQTNSEGGFEGYASTMDLDRGGDIVEMGAFDRSLARHKGSNTKPKMLWNHNPDKVIGVWDEFSQDDKGLYVKGRCIKETALGKDCYELLRAGAIDSMSIGYAVRDYEYEDGGDKRRLKEIDLWEVSLVTFPMLPEARVAGKSDDALTTDLRDLADAFRQARAALIPD